MSPNLLLHLQEPVIVPVIVFIPFVTVVPFHVELVDIRHKIGRISDGSVGAKKWDEGTITGSFRGVPYWSLT